MSKLTLVLGASSKPERFAYLTIKCLAEKGHRVFAVGARPSKIHGIDIVTTPPTNETIHTVTMYLNQQNQRGYINYIITLRPKRLIFNPGSENPELLTLARSNSIDVIFGCTLVMLNAGTY